MSLSGDDGEDSTYYMGRRDSMEKPPGIKQDSSSPLQRRRDSMEKPPGIKQDSSFPLQRESTQIHEIKSKDDRGSDVPLRETLTERRKGKPEEVTAEPSIGTKCSEVPEKDLVDWQKPLAWQVGYLGEKYEAWVHQPVDRPVRLFHSDWAEASTKTPWYTVLLWWIPLAVYLLSTSDCAIQVHVCYIALESVLLYFILDCTDHLFHGPLIFKNYYIITLHFLLHGQHHKCPSDRSRVVFPPWWAFFPFLFFYLVLQQLLPDLANPVFVGGLCGYVINDMIHYYLHSDSTQSGSHLDRLMHRLLYRLKENHMKHHYVDYREGFGISLHL